jgi:hypothetical protein
MAVFCPLLAASLMQYFSLPPKMKEQNKKISLNVNLKSSLSRLTLISGSFSYLSTPGQLEGKGSQQDTCVSHFLHWLF